MLFSAYQLLHQHLTVIILSSSLSFFSCALLSLSVFCCLAVHHHLSSSAPRRRQPSRFSLVSSAATGRRRLCLPQQQPFMSTASRVSTFLQASNVSSRSPATRPSPPLLRPSTCFSSSPPSFQPSTTSIGLSTSIQLLVSAAVPSCVPSFFFVPHVYCPSSSALSVLSATASFSFSALCHNPQLTVVTASFPSPASLHRHPVLLVKQPYTQPLFPASYAPPAGSSQPLRHLQLVGFLLPSSSKLLLTPHRRWPLSLGNHVFASCCLSILTARLLLIPSSQLTSSQPHHLATAACSTLNSPLPSCFQSAQHPPSAQLLSFISMHACHNHGSLPCHTASFGSRLGFLLLLLL